MTATSNDEVPEIRLGGALISLTDVVPGHERDYHRWYEREHMISGMMLGPNVYSARRWVATKGLKDARFPKSSAFAEDTRDGSFLHLYWIVQDKLDEIMTWGIDQVKKLYAQGRMDQPRRNINSGFYAYDWGVFRDEDGVPPELALDHPYKGIAMLVLDQDEDMSGSAIDAELKREMTDLLGNDVAMVLSFRQVEWPEWVPSNIKVADPGSLKRRRVMLALLDSGEESAMPASMNALYGTAPGGSRISYAAKFIPTIPGTDRYIDQL